MGGPKSGSFPGSLVVTELRRELDRLFQEIVAASEAMGRPAWAPLTDILELNDAVVVLIEVPGLASEDLTVSIEGNRLRIEGQHRLSFPRDGEVRFHCLERREGQFRRQIEIYQPVDNSAATATLRRGLLVIELPKLNDRRRQRRSIHVENIPTEDER